MLARALASTRDRAAPAGGIASFDHVMLAIRLFEATNSTMMDSGALEAGSRTLVETYRNWVWRHTTRRMRAIGGAVLCCAQRRRLSGAS